MVGFQRQPRGSYFEDFSIGQKIVTAGRTITESDIVSFAGLTGDYNEIHTNAEYARTTFFEQRVAHGMLGLSIALGLTVQTGMMDGTIVAFREINEWKFLRPVFIGDTIFAELEVVETKAYKRIGNGAVVIECSVYNHKGEMVMKGKWTALILLKGVS